MSYNLHTEAGDSMNGSVHETRESLLETVRVKYGADCEFGEREGCIVNDAGDLVATFGEN